MNKYETIVIIDPNTESEAVQNIIGELSEIITSNNGQITKLQEWGRRRLAYEVKGNKDGIYVLFNFESDPEVIQRMERYFGLSEKIIKQMTVRAEKLPEPRQREMKTEEFEKDMEFSKKYDDESDEDDYDDDEDDYDDEYDKYNDE